MSIKREFKICFFGVLFLFVVSLLQRFWFKMKGFRIQAWMHPVAQMTIVVTIRFVQVLQTLSQEILEKNKTGYDNFNRLAAVGHGKELGFSAKEGLQMVV